MLTVFDVAKYILSKDLPTMSHKKLQKLCYYVQAWSLAVRGKRFMDCEFEAWVHGPVCRVLYNKYRNGFNTTSEEDPNVGGEEKGFLDLVLKIYGNDTGGELETLTHSEKPWREAREGLHYWESSNRIISDDAMASYYLGELGN